MKMLPTTLAGVAIVVGLSGFSLLAQRQSGGSTTPAPQPPSSTRTNDPPMVGMTPMGGMDPSNTPDVLNSRMAEQQAKSRNSERQKRLESDTDKLVGLVNSFKEQVSSDKSLSPADMSKKAEEIEKLAKSVKDRMKG
jgi:hypothetical protein